MLGRAKNRKEVNRLVEKLLQQRTQGRRELRVENKGGKAVKEERRERWT